MSSEFVVLRKWIGKITKFRIVFMASCFVSLLLCVPYRFAWFGSIRHFKWSSETTYMNINVEGTRDLMYIIYIYNSTWSWLLLWRFLCSSFCLLLCLSCCLLFCLLTILLLSLLLLLLLLLLLSCCCCCCSRTYWTYIPTTLEDLHYYSSLQLVRVHQRNHLPYETYKRNPSFASNQRHCRGLSSK